MNPGEDLEHLLSKGGEMTFDRQDLILELRAMQGVAKDPRRVQLALDGATGALLRFIDDEQVTEAFRAIGGAE